MVVVHANDGHSLRTAPRRRATLGFDDGLARRQGGRIGQLRKSEHTTRGAQKLAPRNTSSIRNGISLQCEPRLPCLRSTHTTSPLAISSRRPNRLFPAACLRMARCPGGAPSE